MSIFNELSQAVLEIAPQFVAINNAPNTFRDLKANAYDRHGRIRVYSGASEGTIYATRKANHAFRAWHDSIHLEKNLSFSKVDELQVAVEHCRQLPEFKDILWADVAGQVWYYYKYKKFVENQKEFVLWFMLNYSYGELPK